MTTNATELVIRRFDQHYQNFCGFDTIETAQIYLAVFDRFSLVWARPDPSITRTTSLQSAI
jgi:hypothetical protein